MSKTKFIAIFCSLPIFFLMVVACAAEKSDAEIVRETVVVVVPVTVVVTQSSIVEVEVTRIVEIPATIVLTPTEKPTVNLNPNPFYFEPYPYGTLTDIPEVDAIIREILTKDSLALRERIVFHESTCIHPNDPHGAPCKAGEEIGTQIEVFRIAHCEGYETRDEEYIHKILEDLVSWSTGIYAVSGDLANQNYELFLTSTDNDNAITVFIEDKGINNIIFGCEQPPTEMLELFGNELVLPPISNLGN